jgi:hypothetical protein
MLLKLLLVQNILYLSIFIYIISINYQLRWFGLWSKKLNEAIIYHSAVSRLSRQSSQNSSHGLYTRYTSNAFHLSTGIPGIPGIPGIQMQQKVESGKQSKHLIEEILGKSVFRFTDE